MQRLNSRGRIVYSSIGAFISWVAVILQLYLFLSNRTLPLSDALLQFFSYFTILTTIIIAFTFTVLLLKNQSALKSFLSQNSVLTATAVYIVVVGIVYNLVLRRLWAPEGWQRLADELLHLIVPVYYAVYWVIFVSKKDLQWKDAVLWLVYPLVYLIFILGSGYFSGFYPYPFVNVTSLGYETVFYNSAIIMVLFLFLSLLLIGAGRMSKKE
jgi:hypothetical protein